MLDVGEAVTAPCSLWRSACAEREVDARKSTADADAEARSCERQIEGARALRRGTGLDGGPDLRCGMETP